jgi:hypothetical membrane protein
MIRLRWGALFWILGLLSFPAQLIAAAQWPQRYSWTSNFISDLGVTTCGTVDQGSLMERYICSPAHSLANGSTIAIGATLTIGALLLWSAWPRRRQGSIAMAFLAVSGTLVVLVGALPWDLFPDAHDLLALASVAAQWVGMIVFVFAIRGNTTFRWISVLTIASVIISSIGFVLFIDAMDGGQSATLGLGITERIAFDTITLWSAATGIILLNVLPNARIEAEPQSGERARSKRQSTFG